MLHVTSLLISMVQGDERGSNEGSIRFPFQSPFRFAAFTFHIHFSSTQASDITESIQHELQAILPNRQGDQCGRRSILVGPERGS